MPTSNGRETIESGSEEGGVTGVNAVVLGESELHNYSNAGTGNKCILMQNTEEIASCNDVGHGSCHLIAGINVVEESLNIDDSIFENVNEAPRLDYNVECRNDRENERGNKSTVDGTIVSEEGYNSNKCNASGEPCELTEEIYNIQVADMEVIDAENVIVEGFVEVSENFIIETDANGGRYTILAVAEDYASTEIIAGIETQITSSNINEITPTEINEVVTSQASQETQPEPRSTRKRERKPSKWKRNVKKLKKNSGESYTTASGRTVPSKCVKSPCKDNCFLKCNSSFTNEDRTQIHTGFWGLADVTRQRDFIVQSTSKIEPKYRYIKQGTTRERSNNLAYSFMKAGKKVRVCRKFFMSTLDIGDTVLRNAQKKISCEGFIEGEKRGKHGKQRKLEESIKNSVRQHIESIKRIESHYLRAQTTREFVDGSLNLATLYRMYQKKCEFENVPVAKKCIYEQIFNTEYNIGFFVPKKDQCAICESFKNTSNIQEEALTKYKEHQSEKELSRIIKSQDVDEARKNPSILVACYDLQAVLPTPCGEVSSFYYRSRLNTFNFTIYDISNKSGNCYLWHEGVGLRGANELGSCILQFLKSECQGKEVIFYSDNCCGQNKNKYIAAMYLYAVQVYDIPSITHKFLITGHTQNEGDSMHSCIEKEKKRALRSGPIYVPSQWVPIVKLAKKTGKPYQVNELSTSDFKDLKTLTAEIGNNFNVDTTGNKLVWNDLRVLRAEKLEDRVLMFKTKYDQTDFQKICVVKNKRGRPCETSQIELHNAYPTPPKLSSQKKSDLLALCSSKAIPEVHHTFYSSLPETSRSSCV